MTTTPHLGLPLMAAAQSQKHVTHNMALILLDAMTQCAVKALNSNDPPATPLAGDCYGIGTAPTGAFQSAPAQLAIYDGYAWQFAPVQKGYLVFNLADAQFWFFDGAIWRHLSDLLSSPSNLSTTTIATNQLGIGTIADSTNAFAAKLNAGLFTAKATSEGGSGDMRMMLNKQASANSVSQLYQTNYSGRAETGLTGDDNFHVKLSPDGANWLDALIAYSASGAVRIDQLLLGRSANTNKGRIECEFNSGAMTGAVFIETSNLPASQVIAFRKSAVQVGYIQMTPLGTTYNTLSDYRLKIERGGIDNALERLMALRPRRFAFKSHPETELDGFFAHEVADIVPEAVSGAKDGLDPEGEPAMQGLDCARLVPLLVAALQDLTGRVRQIEAKYA